MVAKRKASIIEWVTAGLIASVLLVFANAVWFIDSPSRVLYHHQKFVAQYVTSREQAQIYELDYIRPGQTVYRWLEYCLDREARGIVTTRWIGPNYFRHGAVRPNFGQLGCHQVSIPVLVPDDLPIGEVIELHSEVEYPREMVGSLYTKNPPIRAMVVE